MQQWRSDRGGTEDEGGCCRWRVPVECRAVPCSARSEKSGRRWTGLAAVEGCAKGDMEGHRACRQRRPSGEGATPADPLRDNMNEFSPTRISVMSLALPTSLPSPSIPRRPCALNQTSIPSVPLLNLPSSPTSWSLGTATILPVAAGQYCNPRTTAPIARQQASQPARQHANTTAETAKQSGSRNCVHMPVDPALSCL